MALPTSRDSSPTRSSAATFEYSPSPKIEKHRKHTLDLDPGAKEAAQRISLHAESIIHDAEPTFVLKKQKLAMTSTSTEDASERSPFAPISNFSPGAFSRTTTSQLPPPTPVKPKKNISSPFVLTALEINTNLKFERDGQVYRLNLAAGLKGDHCQLYHVESERELVPGVPNDRIYVKLFHRHVLQGKGNAVEAGYLRTLLAQYDRLQGNIPTTIIYNRAKAHLDGYLAVEKVRPLQLPWGIDTPIADLSDENRLLLEKIKTFFDFAFNDPSNTPLDLKADNLGLREDGTLVLLDFMEHSEDDDYAFHLIAQKCLDSFALDNREIFNYLSQKRLLQ